MRIDIKRPTKYAETVIIFYALATSEVLGYDESSIVASKDSTKLRNISLLCKMELG